MKQSKLFSLLQTITTAEYELLCKELQPHKRKSLAKLLTALRVPQHESEPEASKVFKSVFGKPYSKSVDYLLRNEYRLLYEWITLQLSKWHTTPTQPDDCALLHFLLNRNASELFEEEYQQAWKKALQADDVDLLVKLIDLNIQYYLTAKTQSLANAEVIHQLSSQRIELLKNQLLRLIRKEEIRLKLSERIISAYKPNTKPTAPVSLVALDKLEQEDLYAQYLSTRALINFARGTEKINLLKSILKNEAVILKYESSPSEAICRYLINLAQEFYLQLNFTEAVKYYKQAYVYFDKMPGSVREPLLINYVLSLMRNGDFELAVKLANTNAALLLGSKILAGRSPFLLAVINLHARQADNAEKYVKLDGKKEGSEFYYFMRIVLSAVFYLRGEIELALRETINTHQAINYELNRDKNLQTQISKPIVAVFKKFFTLLQSSTKPANELVLLKKEIEESLTENNDQSPNSVLTQWLVYEINYLLSSKKRGAK